MSVIYFIRCNTCKEESWVGQHAYLYTDDIPKLERFLFKHSGSEHELSFEADSDINDSCDYTKMEKEVCRSCGNDQYDEVINGLCWHCATNKDCSKF